MIEVMIRDLRSVERADFTIGPLTLIAGTNGAGKTSILSGVARAVAGVPLPPWLNKSEAGALVRVGTMKGGIKVKTPQGETVLAYPSANISAKGTQIRCSEIAAGLLSLPDLDSKKRTLALAELLGATPTKGDLELRLRDGGINQATIDALWKRIETDGWDTMHKRAAQNGQSLKGAWQQVTKQNWGAQKGANWEPDFWTPGQSVEGLEQAAKDARAKTEQAIAAQAVDGAELDRLRALAGTVEEEKVALQYATVELDEAIKLVNGTKEQLNKLPPDDAPASQSCPHCDGALSIEGQKIVKGKPPRTASETKKARENRASLDGRLQRLENDRDEKKAKADKAAERLRVAKEAKAKLETQQAPAEDAPSAESVEAARAAEREAEARYEAAKNKAEADRIHGQIVSNQVLIDALAPEGVRGRKVQQAVDEFNTKTLKPIYEAAGWKSVIVTETLDFHYGARPYEALSESEQMRVRMAFQIAAALRDGSDLVILDRADMLDQKGRGGLINALMKVWGRASLIAMTYSDQKLLPQLGRAGGSVYWLEGGTLSEVAGPERKAA